MFIILRLDVIQLGNLSSKSQIDGVFALWRHEKISSNKILYFLNKKLYFLFFSLK